MARDVLYDGAAGHDGAQRSRGVRRQRAATQEPRGRVSVDSGSDVRHVGAAPRDGAALFGAPGARQDAR
eukprot:5060024-Lingulodinium_polyedra.AAC.1